MSNRQMEKRVEKLKKDIKKMKPGDMGMKFTRKKKAAGGMLKEPPAGNKGKGLRKLPKAVRNKMGYMKDGGRVMKAEGGVANHAQVKGFGAVRPDVKKFGK